MDHASAVSPPAATPSASQPPASSQQPQRRGIDLRTRRLKTTHRLVLGVAGVPSAALLTVGIIVLSTGSAARDVVIGVLIIGMAATVATGVVVTSILLRREAELARLQSEFVSRVSHDLRTPLTSIKMFVETLQLGRAAHNPTALRECLDALGTETERLLVMVDRLLDWARIESARHVYVERRSSVASLVEAALASFESLRVHGDVTLTRAVPDGLPDVNVDPEIVTQALVNVLQNAYHYTPAQKRIGVAVRTRDAMVEIAVADNGPGVAPSERNKIFERFYRGAAAKMLQVRGTGLGLAMVRAVIKAHGGSIRVEGNEPTGSIFTIALPIAEGPR
jgi:two-component system phosphate regulon sensor histidine kinase PhoR